MRRRNNNKMGFEQVSYSIMFNIVFGSPLIPTISHTPKLREQTKNVNTWSISYQESSCNEIQEMKILNPNQNARPSTKHALRGSSLSYFQNRSKCKVLRRMQYNLFVYWSTEDWWGYQWYQWQSIEKCGEY
jgi:hypothetical protein